MMTTQAKVRGRAATHVSIHFDGFSHAEAKIRELVVGLRVERPLLALVCCPLAMIATTLSEQWFLLPALVIASWWWTPSWRWSWLLAAEEGLFGVQWAFVGARSLAAFRDHLASVGVFWIAGPTVLVVAGLWTRTREASASSIRTGRGLPQNDSSAIGDDVVS